MVADVVGRPVLGDLVDAGLLVEAEEVDAVCAAGLVLVYDLLEVLLELGEVEEEVLGVVVIIEALFEVRDGVEVQLEDLDSNDAPFTITQPEFMRRMKEMQATGGGGMFGMGGFPEMYNLVVNTNSELATNILNTADKNAQESLVKQALDLAKLSQNLLKGEELTAFVKRSFELIK